MVRTTQMEMDKIGNGLTLATNHPPKPADCNPNFSSNEEVSRTSAIHPLSNNNQHRQKYPDHPCYWNEAP